MTTQLTLLPASNSPWQLDDRTRAVGRRGLAEARQALAEARARAGVPGAADPFSAAA